MGASEGYMKYLISSFICVFVIALSSCNTTVGLGRDMRILGEQMEKKASSAAGGAGATGDYDAGGAPIY